MKNEPFEILSQIDEGAFGIVLMGRNKETDEIVAIKKIKKKYSNWDECMKLREINSLRKLKHPSIIKLKEVYKQQNELFLVFEHCQRNLFKYYTEEYKNQNKQIPENVIKSLIYQSAQALSYMHRKGYFHRDMKPENIMLTKDNQVKLADFGLAREIRSSPPYTDYVSTRWYRSPEILLKSYNYNSPVDIFALGCIMAELYKQEPLFKGNNEIDQLNKICQILGTPDQNWQEGFKLAGQLGYQFPDCKPKNLKDLIPNASKEALSLLKRMLTFESSKRISATQMLQHPYFSELRIDSGNQKKERNLSLNHDAHHKKQRDHSYNKIEDYYSKLLGDKDSQDLLFSKIKNEEQKTKNSDDLVKTPPKKKNNQQNLDLLLEEFKPDYNLLNSQESKKYIENLSNKKLTIYKKDQKLNSIKKHLPQNQNYSPSFQDKYNFSGSKSRKSNKIDDQIEELLNSTPFKNKQINNSNDLKQNIKNNPSILSYMMKLNQGQSQQKYEDRIGQRKSNQEIDDQLEESKYLSYLKGLNGMNVYSKSSYPYKFQLN